MENLIQDFVRYLKETLGISVRPKKWEGEKRLPFFIRDLYLFFKFDLLDTSCLLMMQLDLSEQTPAAVRKHLMLVKEQWGAEVIYLHKRITAYNRKRLIEHKVPFVVPGNQMYLPPLAIDLREHFRKISSVIRKFSPSTQVVVLHALIHGTEQVYTPSELANRLGYTPMTLTRAFDELEAVELGDVTIKGKERILRLDENKKTLWEKARGFMRSPVKRRLWIKLYRKDLLFVQAGLSALARYSLLTAPSQTTFAISAADWKTIKQGNDVMELPIAEHETNELEIWSYSPSLFDDKNVVDRFSLYLSLQENTDERVNSAIEEMMDGVEW